jgi:hypothetical protein
MEPCHLTPPVIAVSQCPARDFDYSCRTDSSVDYKTSTSVTTTEKFSVGGQVGAWPVQGAASMQQRCWC